MPPKGKKNKGKSKPTVVDGNSTVEMTKEQLEEHIVRLRVEMDREREERNYFQLERDKVNTFWEITKNKLEEERAMIRNKDREMEEIAERHQLELKVYKQKVKHLLYEHRNHLTEQKSEYHNHIKLNEESILESEGKLRKDKMCLKSQIRRKELESEEAVKNLKRSYEEQISKLRLDFERQVMEVERKLEKRMKDQFDEMDLRRKTEIHEVEERKSTQINTLKANHDKQFSEMKNYYNDITLNNLALINTLKETIKELKKKESIMERQMNEITNENRRLTDPLKKAEDENAELRRQLENYENDKKALKLTKGRVKVLEKEVKQMDWDHELLEQRFRNTEKERDQLYRRFLRSVHEVQQKSGLKNLLLEHKLSYLQNSLEKKDVQLGEILSSCNIDPRALKIVTAKLENILDTKNTSIKEMQYELARICKAYNDLKGAYDGTLNKLDGSSSNADFGFIPLDTTLKDPRQIGKGPAGLVSLPPLL